MKSLNIAFEILRQLCIGSLEAFKPSHLSKPEQVTGRKRKSIGFLSRGTVLYAQTLRCEGPIPVSELLQLNPTTTKLWDGTSWFNIQKFEILEEANKGIVFILRSGERITSSLEQIWFTDRGKLLAGEIVVGDCLQCMNLPEPSQPHSPAYLPDSDIGWFVGMYLAEGSGGLEDTIEIASHEDEKERFQRLDRIAQSFGSRCRIHRKHGKAVSACIDSAILSSILRTYLAGKLAKDKRLQRICWKKSNDFLKSLLEGYLEGDGHWDDMNCRWRLGFTKNCRLESNLRTLCGRLGYGLTLNPGKARIGEKEFPCFRGELRIQKSNHHNSKDRGEVIAIRRARHQARFGVRVAGAVKPYALASGVIAEAGIASCSNGIASKEKRDSTCGVS